jgi:hypothetical protein
MYHSIQLQCTRPKNCMSQKDVRFDPTALHWTKTLAQTLACPSTASPLTASSRPAFPPSPAMPRKYSQSPVSIDKFPPCASARAFSKYRDACCARTYESPSACGDNRMYCYCSPPRSSDYARVECGSIMHLVRLIHPLDTAALHVSCRSATCRGRHICPKTCMHRIHMRTCGS